MPTIVVTAVDKSCRIGLTVVVTSGTNHARKTGVLGNRAGYWGEDGGDDW